MKYISTVLFTLVTIFSTANAAENILSVSPELAPVMDKIFELEEAIPLIDEAQKEGPIDIIYVEMPEMNSKALWDSMNRRIIINAKFDFDIARIIHSVLFELQNATATPKLNDLTRRAANGQVNKNEFVEGIEWIEHQNALRTKHLLEKGIAKGIFPAASRWPVPEKFSDHLSMQKSSGHTDFIARKYEILQRNRNNQLPS